MAPTLRSVVCAVAAATALGVMAGGGGGGATVRAHGAPGLWIVGGTLPAAQTIPNADIVNNNFQPATLTCTSTSNRDFTVNNETSTQQTITWNGRPIITLAPEAWVFYFVYGYRTFVLSLQSNPGARLTFTC